MIWREVVHIVICLECAAALANFVFENPEVSAYVLKSTILAQGAFASAKDVGTIHRNVNNNDRARKAGSRCFFSM